MAREASFGLMLLGSLPLWHLVVAALLSLVTSVEALQDPFYAAPNNLSSYSPGQVIRSRKFRPLFEPMLASDLDHSYQIVFRSEDNFNRSIAASASIFVPKKRKQGVFCWSSFIDAVSPTCLPSHAYDGSAPLTLDAQYDAVDPIGIGTFLRNGYVAVSPDHEGPKADFSVGRLGGKVTLDSIRATLNAESMAAADAPITMFGYSGGAQSTVWAETLAESHAPELNIVASSHGGTPLDLDGIFRTASGTASSGILVAAFASVLDNHPEVQSWWERYGSDRGKAALKKARQDNECLPQLVADFAFFDTIGMMQISNPLDREPLHTAVSDESLIQSRVPYRIPAPKWPRWIMHGELDTLVPVNASKQYVHDQCETSNGEANLRFTVFPFDLHPDTMAQGLPTALVFLLNAMEGKFPEKAPCGSHLDTVNLFDPAIQDRLGIDIPDLMKRLNTHEKLHTLFPSKPRQHETKHVQKVRRSSRPS
ncbi:unnamed protein product [Jaminaea pallidilutea]